MAMRGSPEFISVSKGFLARFDGFVERVTEFIRQTDSAVALSQSEREGLRRDVDDLRGQVKQLFDSRNMLAKDSIQAIESVKTTNMLIDGILKSTERIEKNLDKLDRDTGDVAGRVRDVEFALAGIKNDRADLKEQRKIKSARRWDIVRLLIPMLIGLLMGLAASCYEHAREAVSARVRAGARDSGAP